MSVVKIASGSFVTVAGWTRAYEFSTVRSYAAKYNEDQDAAHARARANGHDTCYAINPGTCITSDRAANARALEVERAQHAAAHVVATGDVVEVEGERFTVKVMGERYADPIHFKLCK